MSTSYKRVLPRDLFRESLLLKCLGKLCLLIEDGELSGLYYEHVRTDSTFKVGCQESDGGLICHNIKFFRTSDKRYIPIFTGLARPGEHWPLLCTTFDEEEIEVFDNDGNITDDFKEFICQNPL